jgi:hypothetical protein
MRRHDDEAHHATARQMQHNRPQWRSIWWTRHRRRYWAMHRPTGQIIYSTDPDELARMMDQVEAGARLDPWPWRQRLLPRQPHHAARHTRPGAAMTTTGRAPNTALRTWRETHGLSRAAHGIPRYVHARLIARWEQGRTRWPRLYHRAILHNLTGQDPTSLGFTPPGPPPA